MPIHVGMHRSDRLARRPPPCGPCRLRSRLPTGQPLLMRPEGRGRVVRPDPLLPFGAKLAAGQSTDYGDNEFLTQVRFECADPSLDWLSRAIAVGEGRMHPDCVEYAIYQVVHG